MPLGDAARRPALAAGEERVCELAAERLVGWNMQRSDTTFDGMWRLEAVEFDEDGRPERYERNVDPDEWIVDLLRRIALKKGATRLASALERVQCGS